MISWSRDPTAAQPPPRRPRQLHLRRDVGPRRRHQLGQPRPGVPRRRRPARPSPRPPPTRSWPGKGNQYPPATGIPELRQAVAAHQQRFYGLGYDPDTEVLITAGATEAIAAALLALLEPGDEVIAFEPYYDSYVANIAMAGGVRVPLTLRPPGVPSRPGQAGITDHRQDQAAHAEQPAQPHGHGPDPRGDRGDRADRHRPRPPRGHRRGLRAPHVRPPSTYRSPPSTACAAASSRSARRARRSRSPAGRSAGPPPPRTSSAPSAPPSSSSPT